MPLVEVVEVARRVEAGETVMALPPQSAVPERVTVGVWSGRPALVFDGGAVVPLDRVTLAGPARVWVTG